jgi:hypothetical protein
VRSTPEDRAFTPRFRAIVGTRLSAPGPLAQSIRASAKNGNRNGELR